MWPSTDEVLWLLLSEDPHRVKRGLQLVCNAVEAHSSHRPRLSNVVRLAANRHMISSDILVRRWLYKFIGLVGDETYVPYLIGQLQAAEDDEENLSWAAAAVYGVLPRAAAEGALAPLELPRAQTVKYVCSRYFDPGGPPLSHHQVKRLLASGDTLDLLWLCLSYGKSPELVPKRVLTELNHADDPTVVEYSLWALYQDRAGTITDVRFAPHSAVSAKPNIRRWYYRLLTKDPRYSETYGDVVKWALFEDPVVASREGMALGLAQRWPGKRIAAWTVQRYHEEPDPLVRLAMVRGFLRWRGRSELYRQALEWAKRNDPSSWPALQDEAGSGKRHGGTLLLPPKRPNPQRGVIASTAMTRIASSEDVYAYILALDAVGFSLKTDSEQFTIFNDLLAILSQNDALRRVPLTDVASLLTGDGLIIVCKQVENRHVPLQLALETLETFTQLRSYQLRIGINSGPVRWIHLEDGSRQVIGHSINWAVRIMGVAGPNEAVVSDSYYLENVRSQLDRLRGITFSERSGETKHGEVIKGYLAAGAH
jgi:class 3 adenylate cyclase